MSWTRRAQFDNQREIAFGAIGASYTLIGTKFTEAVRIPFIYNGTDALLQFSSNGVDDHFVVAALSGWVWDITTNSPDDNPFWLPAGSGIYVKNIGAPGSGSVYVMGIVGIE